MIPVLPHSTLLVLSLSVLEGMPLASDRNYKVGWEGHRGGSLM